MMVEVWIASLALAALAIILVVRWADSSYQAARREQRQEFRAAQRYLRGQ